MCLERWKFSQIYGISWSQQLKDTQLDGRVLLLWFYWITSRSFGLIRRNEKKRESNLLITFLHKKAAQATKNFMY